MVQFTVLRTEESLRSFLGRQGHRDGTPQACRSNRQQVLLSGKSTEVMMCDGADVLVRCDVVDACPKPNYNVHI
jgi:hypothetical protein